MRRLLCGLTWILLAAASPASAHTTIIEPPESHFPYQQWVDEAKVPTPTETITVIETDEPCDEAHVAGCVDNDVIEMAPPGPGEHERELFDHELGHVDDREVFTPMWRARFATLVGRGGDPWYPNVEEAFADAYSLCARRPAPPPSGRFRIQQARALTPSLFSRICQLISRANPQK